MQKIKLYLDMCCYNRPYDDQQQTRIHLETLAKLHIQQLLVSGIYDFIWSFILEFENSKNPYPLRRETIQRFSYRCTQHVDETNVSEIVKIAKPIMKSGVKEKDALHVACAIFASCDYFLTTDDRMLKYETKKIKLVTPVQFINKMEGNL